MGADMFPPCRAGRDHTNAVRLHAACIRADDSSANVSIVNTEEGINGMSNERGGWREGEKGKEGQLVPRLLLVKDD